MWTEIMNVDGNCFYWFSLAEELITWRLHLSLQLLIRRRTREAQWRVRRSACTLIRATLHADAWTVAALLISSARVRTGATRRQTRTPAPSGGIRDKNVILRQMKDRRFLTNTTHRPRSLTGSSEREPTAATVRTIASAWFYLNIVNLSIHPKWTAHWHFYCIIIPLSIYLPINFSYLSVSMCDTHTHTHRHTIQ